MQIEPWQRVDKQATDDRTDNYLQGMFDHLAAAGKYSKSTALSTRGRLTVFALKRSGHYPLLILLMLPILLVVRMLQVLELISDRRRDDRLAQPARVRVASIAIRYL